MSIHIDSFSGKAADLPKGRRSPEEMLAVLVKHPRVSVWDLDSWLGPALRGLQSDGHIKFNEKAGAYPWCHYDITDRGIALLTAADRSTEQANQINKGTP